MTKVKNVLESDRFSAPKGYSSWLEYWEKQTKSSKLICGVSGCSNRDLVGAHVQKFERTDKSYYIAPICKVCNNRTDEFYVCWELVPVPGNL